jgi:hypothetical protein
MLWRRTGMSTEMTQAAPIMVERGLAALIKMSLTNFLYGYIFYQNGSNEIPDANEVLSIS